MLKKLTLLILTILFLWTDLSFAQSTDSVVSSIRKKYKHIRDNLKKYDTTIKDEPDGSAEGGETVAYYEGKNVRLIESIAFGETGKYELELYFEKNGQLFFVFEKKYKYNRTIYWDTTHMQESNNTETFDPKKTIINKDRYYFNKEKLVRYLENDKAVDLSLGTNPLIGPHLISHAHKLRDSLKR